MEGVQAFPLCCASGKDFVRRAFKRFIFQGHMSPAGGADSWASLLVVAMLRCVFLWRRVVLLILESRFIIPRFDLNHEPGCSCHLERLSGAIRLYNGNVP